MQTEPCGWEPDYAGCTGGPCCESSAAFDPAIKDLASRAASTILWALTGRRFGLCSVTVRPCKPETCRPQSLTDVIFFDKREQGGLGVGQYVPTLIDGAVYNIACGCPQGCCSCRNSCEVWLPGTVNAITEVRIDGAVVLAADYALYDNSKLVFYNGTCPPCQNYDLPAGEVGTWTVTYTQGTPVPDVLALAAGQYACELARALANDSACQLPKTVQTLSRQGIDIAFADPFALAEQGLTGLPFVDTVVRAINPYKQAQPARVWSPDMDTVRRPT